MNPERKTRKNSNTSVLFIHSSNEMYGADRILLQVLGTLQQLERNNAVVWLPDDIGPAENSLADELARRHIAFEVKPIPIIRRRYLSLRYPFTLPLSILRMRRDIARLNPKVVYLTTSATLLGAIAAKLAGVPSIVLHCQEIWNNREATVLGVLALPVTRCVCNSKASRHSLSGRLKGRAEVILNGVPDQAGDRVSLTERIGPLSFLVASRWTERKGYVTLLRAWDSQTPIGHLVIAGGPPEIGQAVDVRGLVAKLRRVEDVRIAGEVSDISSLVDESDFVLVPSDEPESFGLVAIEAFARGRAVIGSDCGGLVEIVESGLTGQLFTPRSPQSLRATLQALDRGAASQMGDSARDVFELRYSLDVFDRRFKEFWGDTTTD